MKAFKQFVERRYYKYEISTWTRPNIAENGTFYESEFAVKGNRENNSYMPSGFGGNAWQAFDGNASTGWGTYSQSASQHYVTMYSKVPLNITQMYLTFATSSADSGGHSNTYVLVSEDGINYTQIHEQGKTTSRNVTLDIVNTGYYNFYRLDIRTPGGDDRDAIGLYECAITATGKQLVEGTEQDYDLYKDTYQYKIIKESGEVQDIYKAIKSYEKGQYYGN